MANVRLQHIADHARISVGNLAYHFCDKRAIVCVIHQELEKEIDPVLNLPTQAMQLIDFDNRLSTFYFLSRKYAFYFLDVLELERSYSALHAGRKVYIQSMITQIHQWLKKHVELETLKPESIHYQYQSLAHTLWVLITFWLSQQQVRGVTEDESGFKRSIWSQIAPHLTEKGFLEFEAMIEPQLQPITIDF